MGDRGVVGRDVQYESLAADYERHAAANPWNALYDRPAVLDLLGDVDGRRVLDAGCGPGLYAEELVRRGAEVVGFDQSPAMVERARVRVPDGQFRVHDLGDPLDWPDEASFDLVVCALVWPYVDDRLQALRGLRRALRPSGALVLSTTHPTGEWARLGGSYFASEVFEERWGTTGWDMRVWRLPLTRLCDEFADAGFVIERLVEPQPHPEMATVDPATFARLSSSPAFIAFRLRPG